MEEQLESYLRTHENVRSDEPPAARDGRAREAAAAAQKEERARDAARLEFDLASRRMDSEAARRATERRLSQLHAVRAPLPPGLLEEPSEEEERQAGHGEGGAS